MRSLRWVVPFSIVATLAGTGIASAQRRPVPVHRPVTHSGAVAVPRPYYGSYYRPYYSYYRPYYYPYYGYPYYGFYGGWYGGLSVGFGWGYPGPYYGQYPYPYYGHGYYDHVSSARIQVQQRQAEVFIDGYFVGHVDDFDGWSQRLDVQPGEHTLEVYLAGHHTLRQNLLFRPGATIKIEHVMQPLAAGEPGDPRPVPSPRARPQAQTDPDQQYPDRGYAERPDDRPAPPPRRTSPPPADVQSRDYGAIAVRVQPMDAQVLVDGESWQSPDAGSITLQLTEGTHRVEVRKEGFRTYTAEIRVRRGETSSLNVSLSRP